MNSYFKHAEWIFVKNFPQDTCNTYFEYWAEFDAAEVSNTKLYISASTLYTYRDYVRQEIEAVWGKMLYAGATTFWETDGGASDFDNAGSLCHGWSAVPIYLYGKYNLLNE